MTTQLINVYHQQPDYCLTWVIFMLFDADTSARHSISLTYLLTSVGQAAGAGILSQDGDYRIRTRCVTDNALAKWQARHTT